MQNLEKYSPTVLRVGIALVIMWFGLEQIKDFEAWTGIIPEWATSLTGLSALTLVKINAWTEVVLGLAHLTGFYTRASGLILTLHMALITFVVGYNPTGVRDLGITIGALASFMHGVSPISIDAWRLRRQISQTQI